MNNAFIESIRMEYLFILFVEEGLYFLTRGQNNKFVEVVGEKPGDIALMAALSPALIKKPNPSYHAHTEH